MNTKSVLLSFLVIFSCFHVFSQESSSDSSEKTFKPLEERKHEIKIGVIKALAVPVIDLEYEYPLSPYSSVGGNVTVNLNKDVYDYNFSLSPYFRFYFSKSQEYGFSGFFAQGFLGYYNGETYDYIYDYSNPNGFENKQPFNSMAVGFGLGKKWVNKAGFVFQLSIGGGRVLIDDNPSAPVGVFQGDMYVGYRF